VLIIVNPAATIDLDQKGDRSVAPQLKEHHPPSRSNRVRRRVHDRRATQHRRSPGSRETGASSGGRNPAEQHPIPIHPLGAPWPPRSIQGKMPIAISESRRLRRNSVPLSGECGLKPFYLLFVDVWL